MPPLPTCFWPQSSNEMTHRLHNTATFWVDPSLDLTNGLVSNIITAKGNVDASSAALQSITARAIAMLVEYASEEPGLYEYIFACMAAKSPTLASTFMAWDATSGHAFAPMAQGSASGLFSVAGFWQQTFGDNSSAVYRAEPHRSQALSLERLVPQLEATVSANREQQGVLPCRADASARPDARTAAFDPEKPGAETAPNGMNVLLTLLEDGHKEFDQQKAMDSQVARDISKDETEGMVLAALMAPPQEHMPQPAAAHAAESMLPTTLLSPASEMPTTLSSDADVALAIQHTQNSDPAPLVDLNEAAFDVMCEESAHEKHQWFSSTVKQTADAVGEHQGGEHAKSKITTHCLRRIPNDAKLSCLMHLIAQRGCGSYDFLYMPTDLQSQAGINRGYAIINWRSEFEAEHFATMFDKVKLSAKDLGSSKPCCLQVRRATIQGFQGNVINFFRKRRLRMRDPSLRPLISTSAGMEVVPLTMETVPDELKPLLREQDD